MMNHRWIVLALVPLVLSGAATGCKPGKPARTPPAATGIFVDLPKDISDGDEIPIKFRFGKGQKRLLAAAWRDRQKPPLPGQAKTTTPGIRMTMELTVRHDNGTVIYRDMHAVDEQTLPKLDGLDGRVDPWPISTVRLTDGDLIWAVAAFRIYDQPSPGVKRMSTVIEQGQAMTYRTPRPATPTSR